MKSIFTTLFIISYLVTSAQNHNKIHSTNEFLNSLGVNSAIYRRGENLDQTIECINYLGVRWIRTDESMHTQEQLSYIKQLYEKTGAKISTSLGSGNSNIENLIHGSKQVAKIGALLAIEGNNEPNNWGITYNNETGGREKSWVAVARLHRDLYNAVKSDSTLAKYPVWSTTETGAMTDNVGLQYLSVPSNDKRVKEEFRGVTFADIANCHNYFTHPSWVAPQNNQTWLASNPTKNAKGDNLFSNFGITWRHKYQGYDEKSLQRITKVTTETGITNSNVVSEDMQGKMYLSCYLSQFAQGWSHTAIYILRDRSDEAGNQSFGFFDKDYRPRKAAHYLHNMTTILATDSTQTKHRRRLGYKIMNQPPEVHNLLLQHSDDSFALIIWGEFYAGGKEHINVKFNKRHNLTIYNPIKGTTAIKEDENIKQLSLTMSDHPYIIIIRKKAANLRQQPYE